MDAHPRLCIRDPLPFGAAEFEIRTPIGRFSFRSSARDFRSVVRVLGHFLHRVRVRDTFFGNIEEMARRGIPYAGVPARKPWPHMAVGGSKWPLSDTARKQ